MFDCHFDFLEVSVHGNVAADNRSFHDRSVLQLYRHGLTGTRHQETHKFDRHDEEARRVATTRNYAGRLEFYFANSGVSTSYFASTFAAVYALYTR